MHAYLETKDVLIDSNCGCKKISASFTKCLCQHQRVHVSRRRALEMVLSCDHLDAKTPNEGKSHRQIPFARGIALTRTKALCPVLKLWLTAVLKEKRSSIKVKVALGRKSRRADIHQSSSCSKEITTSDHVDRPTKLGSRKGMLCTVQKRGAPFWAVH